MSFGGKNIVDGDRLKFLARPKQEYEPANVYKH
jgi:hypothetical protein